MKDFGFTNRFREKLLQLITQHNKVTNYWGNSFPSELLVYIHNSPDVTLCQPSLYYFNTKNYSSDNFSADLLCKFCIVTTMNYSQSYGKRNKWREQHAVSTGNDEDEDSYDDCAAEFNYGSSDSSSASESSAESMQDPVDSDNSLNDSMQQNIQELNSSSNAN